MKYNEGIMNSLLWWTKLASVRMMHSGVHIYIQSSGSIYIIYCGVAHCLRDPIKGVTVSIRLSVLSFDTSSAELVFPLSSGTNRSMPCIMIYY